MSDRAEVVDPAFAGLRDHLIICAYGRVGRTAARELEAQGETFVVIDRDKDLEHQMRSDGVRYLVGDPTSETLLRRAGIDQARGLISAVDSDADNVYITLTARSLNPELFIVARASEPRSPHRLLRAGADRVISPYVSSGRHMALLALRPRVVDSLEITGRDEIPLRLDEVLIDDDARPQPVADVGGEAIVLVIRRADGTIVPNPAHDDLVNAGDLVVLAGAPRVLGRAEGTR